MRTGCLRVTICCREPHFDTGSWQQISPRGDAATSTSDICALPVVDAHLRHHYLVDPANSLARCRCAASCQPYDESTSCALCQVERAGVRVGE